MLPRVARPRIVAGLAGLRDGIEFPDLLSGADVERGDPAIDAVFVRRRPEDDLVLDDERRDIELKALLPVDERPVPDRLAGLRVDRNQMPVVRGPEQAIPGDREALDDHQVRIRLGGHAVSEGPEAPPGGRVERHDLAVLHGVEHAVHDERRGLHLVEVLGTPHPLQRHTPDVLRLDLIEQTVPLARIAAAVGEPVLRLALRVQHPIQRRRRVRRRVQVLSFRQRRQVIDDVGDLLRSELALVGWHQTLGDDRVLAQARSRVRLELLVGVHQLNAERILIEEPSDNRGAILRHETDGAVLREDILIRRDEGVPKLLAAAQVSDVCQGRSQAGTSIADAVAIEALAALDQSAAVCHCGARAGVLRGAVARSGNDGHHARDGRNSRDGRPPRKYARYRGCNGHRPSG